MLAPRCKPARRNAVYGATPSHSPRGTSGDPIKEKPLNTHAGCLKPYNRPAEILGPHRRAYLHAEPARHGRPCRLVNGAAQGRAAGPASPPYKPGRGGAAYAPSESVTYRQAKRTCQRSSLSPSPDDVQSGRTNMSSKRIAPGYFACGDMHMEGLYMASTRRTSKMVRPPCRAGRRRGYPSSSSHLAQPSSQSRAFRSE
jgi:hypothetical protein